MSFGKGWLRDPHAAGAVVGANVHATLGGAPPPDAALDLLDKAPPIWDQNGWSCCVGMAWARLLSTMTGAIYSPLAVYTLARCVDRPSPDVPLVDEGSMPNQAARAIDRWGVALAEKWPLVGSRINAEPVLAELESCERFQAFHPRGIYSMGTYRSLDVRAALAAGFPVVFGIDVDDRFEAYTGGVLPWTAGSLGGHYLCLLGYETTASGIVFHGHNSWGIGWGERGAFRADESFLDSCGDLYVCEVQQ